jgi:hypothetical protein
MSTLTLLAWIVAGTVLVAALWTAGSVAAVSGLEEAEYAVVERRPGYEVRRYAARLIAETDMQRYAREDTGAAFQAIGGYIFGANAGREKIAMTAPVLMAPATGLTEATAAPATTRPIAGMAFVLPRRFESLDRLPEPDDPRVKLRQEPARSVAALRFGWYATPSVVAARARTLAAMLAADGRAMASAPYVASYNPPFSAPWVQRHDILVDLR